MRRLALLLLILAPSIPRPTGACSAIADNNGEHVVDTEFGTDLVAPSVVTATAVVERDDGDQGGGGCNGAACSDGGSFVFISVHATDDQAPAARLGFQLTVTAGQVPEGMRIPPTAVLADFGDLRLRFPHNAPDFAFDLEIRAVDLNGNVGAPTLLTVQDPA